jgi:hypothetical protein
LATDILPVLTTLLAAAMSLAEAPARIMSLMLVSAN